MNWIAVATDSWQSSPSKMVWVAQIEQLVLVVAVVGVVVVVVPLVFVGLGEMARSSWFVMLAVLLYSEVDKTEVVVIVVEELSLEVVAVAAVMILQ